MSRRIPVVAEDPRLVIAWKRGSVTPTVVASMPSTYAPGSAEYRAFAGRLARLAYKLHTVRNNAKLEKYPGWQDLYRGILRRKTDLHGRVLELTIEPRSMANDDLLAGIGPAPEPAPGDRLPPAAEVIPADILSDMFGPVPDDAA